MLNSVVASALGTLLLTVSPAPVHQSQLIQPPNTWAQLQPVTYATKPGDSLSSVAQSLYGDRSYWSVLWKDNQWIDNPSSIFADWQLRIRTVRPTQADLPLPDDLQAKLASDTMQTPTASPVVVSIMAAKVSSKPEELATPSAVSTAQPPEKPVAEEQTNFDNLYKKAGEIYSVPWQILYGIHKTETGNRGSGNIQNRFGSGATGPMQFMPGTWRAYGVDCNGDGIADITNVDDAVCGAANFMQKHGSIMAGLHSYGGNTRGTLKAAYDRGLDPSQIN